MAIGTVIGGAIAILSNPLVIELVVTGLRAGREAMKILKTADLEALPPDIKAELLRKRDELDAEFDRLMPK